jgi:hypothetical protein
MGRNAGKKIDTVVFLHHYSRFIILLNFHRCFLTAKRKSASLKAVFSLYLHISNISFISIFIPLKVLSTVRSKEKIHVIPLLITSDNHISIYIYTNTFIFTPLFPRWRLFVDSVGRISFSIESFMRCWRQMCT